MGVRHGPRERDRGRLPGKNGEHGIPPCHHSLAETSTLRDRAPSFAWCPLYVMLAAQSASRAFGLRCRPHWPPSALAIAVRSLAPDTIAVRAILAIAANASWRLFFVRLSGIAARTSVVTARSSEAHQSRSQDLRFAPAIDTGNPYGCSSPSPPHGRLAKILSIAPCIWPSRLHVIGLRCPELGRSILAVAC